MSSEGTMSRVVVPMSAQMKQRLNRYVGSDAARESGHTSMAVVVRIALDSFLTKRGV